MLQAIGIILTKWDGQGARRAVIQTSCLKKYVHRLSVKNLLGPRRDSKTAGVPRYVFAAVPVARLLTNQRAEIRALLEDNYNSDSPPAPTTEGLSQQMEHQRVELEDQIADLRKKVALLSGSKRMAVLRSRSARQDWGKRCRERIQAARQGLAEQARVEAEAAVQEDIKHKNVFRNKAHCRARTAEDREATATILAARRLQATQEAEE